MCPQNMVIFFAGFHARGSCYGMEYKSSRGAQSTPDSQGSTAQSSSTLNTRVHGAGQALSLPQLRFPGLPPRAVCVVVRELPRSGKCGISHGGIVGSGPVLGFSQRSLLFSGPGSASTSYGASGTDQSHSPHGPLAGGQFCLSVLSAPDEKSF